ncbi:MAG: tRNA (adenosine(37)-N6)-threonylcarbamoyltransferase complex dimerization subunit type 1 TsaB [Verrucomicrobiota bacterium]
MPPAFTLVLETSTPHASLALVGPDGFMEQREFCGDRNHNAMLFAPLQELLADHGRPLISLVLVGSGPGSYSGTRVGIAAAQGVAIAMGCPAVAVPSILAVSSAQDGAACLALGDARRGSFWTAMMKNYSLTNPPALCDIAELTTLVSNATNAGIAVVSFEEPARFPLSADLSEIVRLEFPNAARLWNVWRRTNEETRLKWSAEIPQPLYLKPPHITPGKRQSLVRS